MTELRLKSLPDDKPVKLQVELPADVHRDLALYAKLMSEGGEAVQPQRLIAPMVQKFMACDRGFAKAKRLSRPR